MCLIYIQLFGGGGIVCLWMGESVGGSGLGSGLIILTPSQKPKRRSLGGTTPWPSPVALSRAGAQVGRSNIFIMCVSGGRGLSHKTPHTPSPFTHQPPSFPPSFNFSTQTPPPTTTTTTKPQPTGYTDKGVSMRCVRADQSSITLTLHYLLTGNAVARVTVLKQEFLIPCVLLLKALRAVTDEELFSRLTLGDEVRFGGLCFVCVFWGGGGLCVLSPGVGGWGMSTYSLSHDPTTNPPPHTTTHTHIYIYYLHTPTHTHTYIYFIYTHTPSINKQTNKTTNRPTPTW
jgi:hypothetical protein